MEYLEDLADEAVKLLHQRRPYKKFRSFYPTVIGNPDSYIYSLCASRLTFGIVTTWENNNTRLNRKAELIKLLKSRMDAESQAVIIGEKYKPEMEEYITEGLKTCCEVLNDAFSKIQSIRRKTTSSDAKQRKGKRNRIAIDSSTALDNAYKTLVAVENGESPNWIDVAISLLAVTGRRMAEVMGMGTFEALEDEDVIPEHLAVYEEIPRSNYVRFTGQLKGGDKTRNETRIIPTLVPSHLVLSGIEYLDSKNRRNTNPDIEPTKRSAAINARYGKDFSTRLSSPESLFSIKGLTPGLPDIELEDGRKGEDPHKLTTHRFRANYLRVLCKFVQLDVADGDEFQMAALLDKTKSVIEAYQRYEIKNKSTLVITE